MKRTRINLSGESIVKIKHLISQQTFDLEYSEEQEDAGVSPVDLLAAAVGLDMIVRIQKYAMRSDSITGDISLEIAQINRSNPERLAELHIELKFVDQELNETDKSVIETLALNGPVSNSIHPNIMFNVKFRYE